jgi:hypothetical protein
VSGDSENGLFRGSEFRTLMAWLAVLVVGWPLVIFWAVYQKQSRPARPAPASLASLPPPVDREELKGVEDLTPASPRDNPGYKLLFDWTRDIPAPDLAAKCRHDVVFSQLAENPARFRGMPIHLDGTARRISIQDEISKAIVPSGKYYEAWTFTSDGQSFPYVLAFEQAPPGLPTGNSVSARLSFDGFFLKKILYVDGEKTRRWAPLLIGRVAYEPPAQASSTFATFTGPVPWYAWPLGVLFLYVTLRVIFSVRRPFSPKPLPRTKQPRPTDEIDPDALADWVHSAGTGEPNNPSENNPARLS